ncbi:MAG: hypothetical protein J7480_08045 [Microbacteriaceae bacterium]|nr:hypothetical protein [Microbacteriaceae bacterium]
MAATVLTLLRLRFQVLANTLRRSPVMRLAVIFGALQALVLVAVAYTTARILLIKELPFERQAPWVVTGALVTLGWIIAPLIVGGAGSALDPRKLARFPLRPGRILAAEFLVGVAWVPGAATLLAALAAVYAWSDYPLAALVAVPSAALVLVTCVVGSRAATALAGNLVDRHGAAGRVLATFIAAAVMLAPIGLALAVFWPPWANFEALVDAIALTPLGAVWAIPGYVADGRTDRLLLSLLVALGTILVLGLLWWLALRESLRSRGAAGHRLRSGSLGVFRLVPTGPVGAIAARSLVLWVRDPRLVVQLVIIPAVPILFLLLAFAQRLDWLAFVAAPIAAGLLPLAQFAGISYDGTAFSSEVAAAVRGRADRLGRALALLVVAVPIVGLVAVLAPLAVGSPTRVPAVLGLAFAALLTGTGIASVSSALVVVPVPATGRNPFSAPPGSNTTQVVGSYVVTGATGTVLAPIIVLGAFALATGDPVLGWGTLVAGLLWGGAALTGGIVAGGRILDQNAPELLARLRRLRMR